MSETIDPTDEPQAPRRGEFRPRLSLLSLLMLTGLVASWITTALLWREIGPLRAEVRQLRSDSGVLTVDDPELIHAIGVETYVEKAWKWRVWVPAGRRVAVHVTFQDVPNVRPPVGVGDHPQPSGWLEINRRNSEGAEVEVTLAAEKTLAGELRWSLSEGGVTQHYTAPEGASKWLVERFAGSVGGGRVGVNLSEHANHPLVLLHQRIYYQRGGQMPPPQPAATGDGVMAWVAEYEE